MSSSTRVYVQTEKEAPDDAVLREGENGGLYYEVELRGNHGGTGAPYSEIDDVVDTKSEPNRRQVLSLLGKQDEEFDDPCWDGYEMVGTKIEDGEKVPNCVPEDEA